MTSSALLPCTRCHFADSPPEANFCSRCGTPLRGPPCPACGAASQEGDEFCNQCGKGLVAGTHWRSGPVAAPGAGRARAFGGAEAIVAHGSGLRAALLTTRVSWTVAGMLAVALVLVLVLGSGGGGEITLSPGPGSTGTPPPASGSGTTALGPTTSVDLGSMTPREAATRLFDRVMTAVENGNQAEAVQFLPMAIASYDRIAAPSLDDHFHLSMLHAVNGDGATALTTAEACLAIRPTHLLCLAAGAQAALLVGDGTRARAHYQTFVDAFDSEVAADLPEYGLFDGGHGNMLPTLRSEALAYLAGTQR